MLASDNALPTAGRKVLGDVLQSTLIDLLALAMTAKQAHWNLYGHGFRSLHLHLDDIAATCRDLADDVAERAAALSIAPDGRPTTVATTVVGTVAAGDTRAFPGGRVTVDHARSVLAIHYGDLIARMRQRITDTADIDPITQDLLISVAAELEKQHWTLQAESPPDRASADLRALLTLQRKTP